MISLWTKPDELGVGCARWGSVIGRHAHAHSTVRMLKAVWI